MGNNLIWAAVGAAANAFLSKTSELEYIGGPGQFDRFANALPNFPSQLGFLGFTKMDEALALGDAAAAVGGMVTKKSELTWLGLGGIAGLIAAKKLLGAA